MSIRRLPSCLALVFAGLLLFAGIAAAQTPPEDHPMPASGGQDPAGIGEYPSLHISGFGDVNYVDQDKSEGTRGFALGQFVLHMASALSPRVNFFGELSFTPRADAGTGSPPADRKSVV